MLTLYNHNLSVCVQKVRIALTEKGQPWEDRNIDLMRSEQVSPEYLKLNPGGVVPTLVHDGKPVIESTVILEYVDDAFPEPPLKPADPHARAAMRLWIRRPDMGLHAACGTISYAAIFGKQLLDFHGMAAMEERWARLPDQARAARQRALLSQGIEAPFVIEHLRLYDTVLADMESVLADRPWLAGDGFSLAECALLPYLWRLERLGLEGMWRHRPQVAGWFDRCKARPSWDPAMEAYPPMFDGDYNDDLRGTDTDLWPTVERLLAA